MTADHEAPPNLLHWLLVSFSIVPFLATCTLLLAGCDAIINDGRSIQMEQRLIQEAAAIRPYPEATSVEHKSGYTVRAASTRDLYLVRASYQQIRQYYDAEMSANGWSPCGEKSMRDWGKDYGGMTRYYEKGDLGADLYYPGSVPGSTYTFALLTSWGRGQCDR